MATNSVIGALRVNLGIDTAVFDKGLKQAQSGLARFGQMASRGLAVAGAALASAMTAAGFAIKGVIDDADQLGKMAQSIGIPVEELSRLKHVAELSDVSLQQLATSVGRLSRNMSDVAAGVGAEATRAFEQLGISVKKTDGTLKSSSAIMAEVADRFAAMPDGAQKTALAMQLMGRAGAQMIPMLNGGAASMNSMMQEADRLGIVIDTKTAKSAEAFNDNITRLQAAFRGIVTTVTTAMLPSLENLSRRFVDIANNGSLVHSLATNLQSFLPHVAGFFAEVAVSVATLHNELVSLTETLRLIKAGEFGAAFENFRRAGQETAAAFAEFERFKAGLFAKPIATTWSEMAVAAGQANVQLSELADTGETIGQTIASGVAPASAAIKDLGTTTAATFDTLETRGSAVFDTLQSSFGTWIDSAVNGTFKLQDALADLLKSFAKLALNNVFTSLAGALFPGMGGGFNIPAFAQGGSAIVGGVGGIDSKIAMLRVTPGERIDVSKDGEGSGGGVVNIVVEASPFFDARVKKIAGPVAVEVTTATLAGAEKQRVRERLRGD